MPKRTTPTCRNTNDAAGEGGRSEVSTGSLSPPGNASAALSRTPASVLVGNLCLAALGRLLNNGRGSGTTEVGESDSCTKSIESPPKWRPSSVGGRRDDPSPDAGASPDASESAADASPPARDRPRRRTCPSKTRLACLRAARRRRHRRHPWMLFPARGRPPRHPLVRSSRKPPFEKSTGFAPEGRGRGVFDRATACAGRRVQRNARQCPQ